MVYCNIGTDNKETGIGKLIYWVEDDWTSKDINELWDKYDIIFKDNVAIMLLTNNEIAIGKEENGEITFYFNFKENRYQHSSPIEYFKNFVNLFKLFETKMEDRNNA